MTRTAPPLSRRGLLAAAAACAWPAQAAPALVIGLTPYLSPTALLAAWRPLREHLSAALARPVETYTARDYPAMLGRARSGAYDIALLPPHVAWLALHEWGFLPVAGTLPKSTALVLVHRDSRVRRAADLRGGRIGGLDPLSIVVASAFAWLQREGVTPARELNFVPQPSVNSGLHALARGDIDALAITSSQLHAAPPDTPRADRVLQEVGEVPGPLFLARPGPAAPTLARWRSAFLSFKPDPTRPLTAANTTMRPFDAAALEPVAAYAAAARALIGDGR